ncbi:ATPase component of uncharacterized ABC-type transporter [Mesotoga prima MesG1.Ag.4.2]|uniref:ATPase component of uncharacterized ABC-type transporter n=2 Tax=Mesotoga TaxID=1184396 RepID=I2F469_9BACT|nr:ABC transporter ATP-binding protein [Mesotoga prima]AFK06722.1 ATPase component of uncharacterized ABC-type transporter [Mesotoga prima MesG1.Ag.4.2]
MADLPILEMRNITKAFPGVIANENISLDLKKGEVHALLGENGAGKTTLMNILFGIYKADEGEIFMEGKQISISSPHNALKYGIGMVQQHFTVVPSFTVAENIVLGLKGMGFFIKTKTVESSIEKLGKSYDLPVNPRARVWTLSVGEKQRIEILKLLYTGAKVIILDEPTAVLTPQETEILFKAMRKLVNEGSSVIFISHKLDEVLEISDRVTVLRGGKVVGTEVRDSVDRRSLVRMMVGRDVLLDFDKPKTEPGKTVLQVENLTVKNDKNLEAVKNLSLSIKSGEILGIAGVAGNGQRELAEAIYGLRKPVQGKVVLNDKILRHTDVAQRIKGGVAFIPQDRRAVATCPSLSITENVFMKNSYSMYLPQSPFNLNTRAMQRAAKELISDYSISTPSTKTQARFLSGGNLQKLVLARELSTKPCLIIAEHPTRGLDIGAMEFVYKTLLAHKERGAAILLLAGELYEIFRLSDRVAVIYEGEIMGYTPPDPSFTEEIGFMMAGSKRGEIS